MRSGSRNRAERPRERDYVVSLARIERGELVTSLHTYGSLAQAVAMAELALLAAPDCLVALDGQVLR